MGLSSEVNTSLPNAWDDALRCLPTLQGALTSLLHVWETACQPAP